MGLLSIKQAMSANQTNQASGAELSPEIASVEQSLKSAGEAVKSAVFALGQKYFEVNQDNPDAKFGEQIAAVKECIEKEKLWHQYRLFLDGKTKCENCGAIITSDSVFCNKCGGSIAPRDFSSIGVASQQPIVSEESSESNVCPSCGSPLVSGALFCEKCGHKL